MLNARAIAWLVLFLAAGFARLGMAEAQEFSADLVVTRADEPAARATGKIFVAGSQVRIETPDLPDGIFLLNTTVGSAYFLRPARRLVMDAKESSLLTQLLVPVAPEQPCVRWQEMAVIAGAADQGGHWRCEPSEGETIEGRRTLYYEAVSPRNVRMTARIDVVRGFPVRVETAAGMVVELENFRDAAPPADLFAIPAGFQKFDPRGLMDRIKQSDVWVELPK